jgi:PIN domain nuclease of toxin-antitoxin system
MSKGLLLDTCAVIWMVKNEWISSDAEAAVDETLESGKGPFVSVITAWELGMLMSKQRLTSPKEPLRWYTDFLLESRSEEIQVSHKILMSSSFLPLPVHNDPTDRIIIATAREHDLTIVTRDRAILTYGALGHVRVLEC